MQAIVTDHQRSSSAGLPSGPLADATATRTAAGTAAASAAIAADRTAGNRPRSNPRPLDGVRVLDLTVALAGPYASLLLGGMGAEVIRIEPPGGGDIARTNP